MIRYSTMTILIVVISIAYSILFITTSFADVYVYEVNTVDKRYVTVSMLQENAYRYYNGGDDVIAEMTVLQVYPEGSYQQAMEDYNIQGNNYGALSPIDAEHDLSFRPHVWWR